MSQSNNTNENLGQPSEPITTETATDENANANEPAIPSGDTSYCLVVGNLLENLECNICTDVLTPPVRMCRNGHSICSSCLSRVGICGFCESGFSKARNYTMENILNTCSVPCEFQKHGCPEVVLLSKYAVHINNCPMNPNPLPEVAPIRARRVPVTSNNNSNNSSITSSPASPQRRRLTHFYDEEYDDFFDEDDPYSMAIPYSVQRRRRPSFQELVPTFPRYDPIQPDLFATGHRPHRRRNEDIESENSAPATTFPSSVLSGEDRSMNSTFPSPSFTSIHHSTPRDNNNNSRQNSNRQMRRRPGFASIPLEPPTTSSNINATPSVTQSIGYFYPSNTTRNRYSISNTGNPFSTLGTTIASSFFSSGNTTENSSPLRRSNSPDISYGSVSSVPMGSSTYINRSFSTPTAAATAAAVSNTPTTTTNPYQGMPGSSFLYNPVGLRRSSGSSNNNNNSNSSSTPNVIPVRQPFTTVEYHHHHQVTSHPHVAPYRVVCSTPNPINPVQSNSTPPILQLQTTRANFMNSPQFRRFEPLSSVRLISGNNTVQYRPEQYVQYHPTLSTPSSSSFVRAPLLSNNNNNNTSNISMPQSSNRNTIEQTITIQPIPPSTANNNATTTTTQQQQVPKLSDHTYTQSMTCNPFQSGSRNRRNPMQSLFALGGMKLPTGLEDDFDMIGDSSENSGSSSETSSSSDPSSSSSLVLTLNQSGEDVTENRQNLSTNDTTTTTPPTSTNQSTINAPTSSTEATINYSTPQENLNQSRYHSLFLRINSNNNNNNNTSNENNDSSSSEPSASFNTSNNNNNSTVNYEDVEDYMDVSGEGARFVQCPNCNLEGLSVIANFCTFCYHPLQTQ